VLPPSPLRGLPLPRTLAARLLLLVLAPLLALLSPAPAAAAPQEAPAELRELPAVVAAETDPGPRAVAVSRAAGLGTVDAAKAVCAALAALDARVQGQEKDYERAVAAYREVDSHLDVAGDDFKTRTERQNTLAFLERRRQADGKVFDALRDGLASLKDPGAVAAAAGFLRGTKTIRVKEVGAEGLGRAASDAGRDFALRMIKDPEARVRIAALRGLSGRKDKEVLDAAIGALRAKDAPWPVRQAAAACLAASGETRAVKPLIEALGAEDGRLRDDIRDMLRTLTGQNFEADPEDWKRWYGENLAAFEGPEAKTALFGAFKSKGPPPEKKGVYGIESRSRRILFIIDTSGSMKDPLKQGPAAAGTATGLTADEEEELRSSKMAIAKRELTRAVRALEADAHFNIVAYATHIVRWKDAMVKADMPVKNEAYQFISELQPAGGTWTYGALQEGFRLSGMGVTDKYYDPAVDTIYLISDGAPTDNNMDKPQFMDAKIILEAVREWNRLGRVLIHAVAVDSKAAGGAFVQFMKSLAAENGGQYTQRE
jgi:uncharacterized protein YegL